ncbi:prefoldin subunit 2-like [Watersipora subatra]|uniref:prefoldin subunit 2-like n=1 Tax=Watersipora subatra TaxID=2589382 RepID=UPI00355AF1C7
MTTKSTTSKQPSQEQIVNGFNELRNQQRQYAVKLSEITDERKEYQLVLDTLKNMEKDRICYRMIGEVLVQKTVGEVMPKLQDSVKQMGTLIDTLETQIKNKGQQLVEYREKHKIKLQSEAPTEKSIEKLSESKSSGVLVTN